MRFVLLILLWLAPVAAGAQALQDLLQEDPDAIADPSRRTVQATLDRLEAAAPEGLGPFLEAWQGKALVRRASDGLFFVGVLDEGGHRLLDVATGSEAGRAGPREVEEIKPNAGVRGLIGQALVAFQLADPDPVRRRAALDAIAADPAAEQMEPLRASLGTEGDAGLRARKERLLLLLAAQFAEDRDERLRAIAALGSDVSTEGRAVLSRIARAEAAVAPAAPEGAPPLVPGTAALPRADAHALLIEAGLAPAPVPPEAIRAALLAAAEGEEVAGVPLASLGTDAAREAAYDRLAAEGGLPPRVTEADVDASLAAHAFFLDFAEPDEEVALAAEAALGRVGARVAAWGALDLGLDALSLSSIIFLAAVGLAITFGVMGVINMAHGEFITIGAYTGFLVQALVPGYTLSLLVALPLAFLVAAGAGVALERLVIRHLAHRPLETLLATFGVSIALQQVAKNVFGTQARPLTAPAWLDGAWVVNDVAGIALIRVAIFALALLFLGLLLYVLRRTRLGLEVRAVTQNPGMAASLGIDPDRVGMLAFALGSGIAGVAGLAIGLYAQVTTEMGQAYVVGSFMAVVVGGVGSVLGALAGAGLIGTFQKAVEWLNPSNTLAAQTFMILFVILFIQVRPRGIVALKGRAAGR